MTGLVASFLWTSPAVADGGACPAGEACLLVTVTGTVQETVVVTGTDLDTWHDMVNPHYTTHSPSGVQSEPQPPTSTSIPAILRSETIAPTVPIGTVRFVTLRSDNGATTRLAPADLTQPGPGSGFEEGLAPGFFADGTDGDRDLIRFARPARNGGDLNYLDVWTTETRGTATMEVHTTGSIVHPVIQAPATSQSGAETAFSVSYDGVAPPDPTYRWTFGDGATATGPSPRHAWSTSGTFSVTLDVIGSDTSEGAATPVRVQVGAAPPPTGTTEPGTGTGGATSTVTGPVKGKGKTPGSTTPPSGEGAAGTTAGAGTGTSGAGTTVVTEPTPGKKAQVAVQAGTSVSGTLLVADALTVAPAPSSPRSAASARAVPDPIRDWRWLWFLVLPGLLLVGAAGQSRWLHRRLPTVPWRIA